MTAETTWCALRLLHGHGDDQSAMRWRLMSRSAGVVTRQHCSPGGRAEWPQCGSPTGRWSRRSAFGNGVRTSLTGTTDCIWTHGGQPTWTADVIDWEDFGLPIDPEVTADAICKAFGRAKRGETRRGRLHRWARPHWNGPGLHGDPRRRPGRASRRVDPGALRPGRRRDNQARGLGRVVRWAYE